MLLWPSGILSPRKGDKYEARMAGPCDRQDMEKEPIESGRPGIKFRVYHYQLLASRMPIRKQLIAFKFGF